MAPMIGEFEIDPSAIVETPVAPAKTEVVLEVESAERKLAPKTGNQYIALQLNAVDYPGNKLFLSYFLTSKALADRRSIVSWKKFLDKVRLPYTTTAPELKNFRFKALLKHEGSGDEARAEVESVVSAA